MTLWEILKANKTGIAPDMFTMLAASKMNGGRDRLHELSGIPPLSFTAKGKPLTAWSITGNTVQNGTPTPENPVEVQAVGDRTGNLFKAPKYTSKTENGVTWESNGDGTITVSGIASGYSTFRLANAYQIPSDCVGQKLTFNYRIGKVSNIVWDSIVFFDENNTEVGRYSIGNSDAATIEIESNFKKVNASIKRNNNYEVSGTVGLMLNSGSTALPYEPYGYKIPVVTRGKNLIDVANLTGKTGALFTDNINPKLAQVKFDEATQYTISMKFEIDTSLGWRKITFTYTDGTTSVSPWIAASDLFKYTSTSGKTIAKVEFTNYNYYGDVYVEYIQLESGTEATEYSPYIEPITTPIYLPTPLYSGEVMRSNGTITRSDGTTETFTAPQIPTLNGTTVIDVDTAVKPESMTIKYRR